MWYVVQVRTGTEEDIQKQCEKLISKETLERSFIPYCEQMKRYHGKWHKETKILFPGYIFLVSPVLLLCVPMAVLVFLLNRRTLS